MAEKRLFILIPVFSLLFIGCTVNPVTGRKQLMLISSAQQLQLGRQYAPEIEKQLGGRIENLKLQNYINRVGQRIARVSHRPEIEFHYTAVNDESINAMALPGGYVFITRGMLEQLGRESQLAAILSHETVHVTASHSAQSMSNQIGLNILLSAVISEKTPQSVTTVSKLGSQLLHLGHSRKHELEADSYGLDYLAKAGYNPYAMIEVMQMLEEQNEVRPFEYFSTHPSPQNRKEKLTEKIQIEGYHEIAQDDQADYREFVLSYLKD